jgi:hypothetical protein
MPSEAMKSTSLDAFAAAEARENVGRALDLRPNVAQPYDVQQAVFVVGNGLPNSTMTDYCLIHLVPFDHSIE